MPGAAGHRRRSLDIEVRDFVPGVTLQSAQVEIGDLYSLYNVPYINQVYLLFRARLLNLDFSPGFESLEVQLFSEQEIPWNTLAFRAVHYTLQNYFADRKTGNFRFRIGTLQPPAQTG